MNEEQIRISGCANKARRRRLNSNGVNIVYEVTLSTRHELTTEAQDLIMNRMDSIDDSESSASHAIRTEVAKQSGKNKNEIGVTAQTIQIQKRSTPGTTKPGQTSTAKDQAEKEKEGGSKFRLPSTNESVGLAIGIFLIFLVLVVPILILYYWFCKKKEKLTPATEQVNNPQHCSDQELVMMK